MTLRTTGPTPEEERLHRRILQVCDVTGEFIEYWGFKSIHGRIWTLLALRREPMNQIDIGETLGVSRSLISTAMSQLVEYGLVRPVSDHRLAPYEASVDVWPTIAEVLRGREWMMLESARNTLEAALLEAEEFEKRGGRSPYDPEHIRMLLTMTELAQSFLKILLSVRVPGSMAGIVQWVTRAKRILTNLRSDSQ
jgi:DNA-binding transcriptional regulator GbsR (MarR family)